MPVDLNEVGRVQALVSVDVHPRVDGQIVKVPIKAGQSVKAGQLLFQLDPREIDAQLGQARATVAKDRSALESLQHDIDRYQPMAEQGYVSQQQLQQTQDALASAQSQLQADTAQLQRLQVQRSYYDIHAPIDGRIGPLILNVGSQVLSSGTTALVKINKLSPIYVVFSVPQDQLPALRKAMTAGEVPVSVDVAGGRHIDHGHLAYIDNTIDPTTNTLSVRALFANGDDGLWPGQYVTVTVTLSVQPDAVVIPETALQTGQDGSFVFVLQGDHTVRATPVTVDRNIGQQVVIAKGVDVGEQVVVRGQLRLSSGARVKVRPSAPASAVQESGTGPDS